MPIGKLVARVLDDLGIVGSARIVRVAEQWEEAVGPEVARHCRPVAFSGDVLEAEVESSVWCQQLKLRTPELLARLQSVCDEDAPRALRFRLGVLR